MARTMALMLLVALLVAASSITRAQSGDSTRPTVTAVRIANQMRIDGKLIEPEWQHAGVTAFTQRDPVEGAPATEKTEVWVAYDDEALYVAARCYDSPDSITAQIGRRDAGLDCDWFVLCIDSYHDRRSGYYFSVNPAGAIGDGILFNESWDDNSWDGVWSAATSIDQEGWTAELRIPYSQLRFPEQESYVWGINFQREIKRKNETSWFVMVPKKENVFVSRFADLVGITDIHPPRRLEILPYLSSTGKFLRHDAGDPFNPGQRYLQNAGADIKIGLGSNLTLNGTINPDFGQVEVDPAVVNLTQFETSFSEKRPFFVEGSNLFDFGFGGSNNNWGFNWGTPTFFYSRRIGRQPVIGAQHNGFTDMPDQTRIIGAAKLNGKVSEGWSLGVLTAVTAREFAEVDSAGVRFSDQVEPLTSYSIARTQGEFDKGRHGLGFIATAAIRDLNESHLVDALNRRAFTLGTDGWMHLDSAKAWVLTGWLAGSRVEGTHQRMINLQRSPLHYFQRPDLDAADVDSHATSLSGLGGRFALNKQTGGFSFNSALGFITPGFESTDMGFLFRTNVVNGHLVMGYSWYEPDGFFRRKGFNLATFRSFDFDGNIIGHGYFVFYNVQFMNYWGLNGNFSYSPSFVDTRTTRGGPKIRNTNQFNGNVYIYSDSRQLVTGGLSMYGGRSESGGWIYSFDPEIQWKASPSLRVSLMPSFMRDVTMAYYVAQKADSTAVATYGRRFVFAKLDQRELGAAVRLDWTFTPALSLQFYLQPLVSVGHYSAFKTLERPDAYAYRPADVALDTTTGNYRIYPEGFNGAAPVIERGNPDFNFKSLRGNAVLRWEYMPGSTLYVVWTHQKTSDAYPGDYRFGRNFAKLLDARGDNVFQVKISYWWNP